MWRFKLPGIFLYLGSLDVQVQQFDLKHKA